ncbi:MAG: iron-containing redox enzyme family protein [Alphaproteobacteria bacterium]
MTTDKSATPNVVEVWSDGGYLSQTAVAVLTEASSGTATRVVERNVHTISPKEIDVLGIRATPTIMCNGTVAFVGIPSPEDAFVLIKRAEIDRVILEWAVSQSQALRQFAEGNSSNKSVALSLAREFQPFCFEFPLFLAAAISHIRDDKSRLLLVSNLYEEHGNLELDRFHPALFRKFMRGIGVEPDSLELDPASPGVQAAERVTAICREGPAYKALATLYAIELSFAPICDVIVAGLKHLKLSAETEYFWILHSGADVEHAEQLRAALLNVCRSPEDWHSAVELAGEISQMFFTLFDYIARADVVTTDEELEVYETVKRICNDSPSAAKYPVQYKDAVYYFGINLGPADRWFLRAFCDAQRHSLVSRLPLQQVTMLAPGFVVEAAPAVFGASRVYFNKPQDLEKARALVLSAYEREIKRAEIGSAGMDTPEAAGSW